MWCLCYNKRKNKKQTKIVNKDSEPNGCRQPPRDSYTSPKKTYFDSDYREQLSLHLEHTHSRSEATSIKNLPTVEPVHSTQFGGNPSLDKKSARPSRSDILPDTTKSPKRRTKKPQGEVRPLSATLGLNKHDHMLHMLYIPLQIRNYENYDLLDTGAIGSAMSFFFVTAGLFSSVEVFTMFFSQKLFRFFLQTVEKAIFDNFKKQVFFLQI